MTQNNSILMSIANYLDSRGINVLTLTLNDDYDCNWVGFVCSNGNRGSLKLEDDCLVVHYYYLHNITGEPINGSAESQYLPCIKLFDLYRLNPEDVFDFLNTLPIPQ